MGSEKGWRSVLPRRRQEPVSSKQTEPYFQVPLHLQNQRLSNWTSSDHHTSRPDFSTTEHSSLAWPDQVSSPRTTRPQISCSRDQARRCLAVSTLLLMRSCSGTRNMHTQRPEISRIHRTLVCLCSTDEILFAGIQKNCKEPSTETTKFARCTKSGIGNGGARLSSPTSSRRCKPSKCQLKDGQTRT